MVTASSANRQTGLTLRPLTPADEQEARRAHRELDDEGFPFLLGDQDPDEPWPEYLSRLSRIEHGVDLPADLVAASFRVADVNGVIVGRASVRHELNDFLARWGGHIGYAVRPAFRRRGYATEILRQSLAMAHELGIASALVTCDDGNVGSARVIERCGGILEGIVPGLGNDPPKRRYWAAT